MEVLCAVIQRQRFAFKAFGSATLHNVLLCLISIGLAEIVVSEMRKLRCIGAGYRLKRETGPAMQSRRESCGSRRSSF